MKAQNNCLGDRGCVFLLAPYQPLNRPRYSKATTATLVTYSPKYLLTYCPNSEVSRLNLVQK